MWVRTQDREGLYDVRYLEIFDLSIIGNETTLATYSTKERCLEVLDEIEAYINGWGIRVNGDVLKTFQMPQDTDL